MDEMIFEPVEDRLGSCAVPINHKPSIVDNAVAVYINLFDNGEVMNGSRFRISLSFIDENNRRTTYNAGILNKFEPARWFRNTVKDPVIKEQPFYRQFLEYRSKLNKDHDFYFKPSAGFFYPAGRNSQTLDCAYAYMVVTFDDEHNLDGVGDVAVGIRFFDFVWDGNLEYNHQRVGNGPAYRATIKFKEKEENTKKSGWSV